MLQKQGFLKEETPTIDPPQSTPKKLGSHPVKSLTRLLTNPHILPSNANAANAKPRL